MTKTHTHTQVQKERTHKFREDNAQKEGTNREHRRHRDTETRTHISFENKLSLLDVESNSQTVHFLLHESCSGHSWEARSCLRWSGGISNGDSLGFGENCTPVEEEAENGAHGVAVDFDNDVVVVVVVVVPLEVPAHMELCSNMVQRRGHRIDCTGYYLVVAAADSTAAVAEAADTTNADSVAAWPAVDTIVAVDTAVVVVVVVVVASAEPQLGAGIAAAAAAAELVVVAKAYDSGSEEPERQTLPSQRFLEYPQCSMLRLVLVPASAVAAAAAADSQLAAAAAELRVAACTAVGQELGH